MNQVAPRKVTANVRTIGAIGKFAARDFQFMLTVGNSEKQDVAESRRILSQIGYDARGIRVHPEEGCDHVVGSLGSILIRRSQWQQACDDMAQAIAFFNLSKFAVAHPGHLLAHQHCPDCGEKLDREHYRERALFSTAQGSTKRKVPAFSREDYDAWIADPLNNHLPMPSKKRS
ncbi:hypothetical protein ABIC83_002453 [Roseateles asaccharophilus]|uniref:hypothetical protein n=1 Tax=Roseateles asaccharophilus TaxID=582607 RepID=UPI0038338EA9